MDYIILGLLMSGQRTGYEIQRLISVQMGLICSASPGSVRAAISRLENEGFVKVSHPTGPRSKRMVNITKPGVIAFGEWLKEPMRTHGAKSIDLAKLFFLDYVPEKHRQPLIEEYVQDLRRTQNELQEIRKLAEEQESDSPRKFPRYALAFGIDSAQFRIDWFTKLLQQLKSGRTGNDFLVGDSSSENDNDAQ